MDVKKVLASVMQEPEVKEAVTIVQTRAREFPSPLVAMLSGIGMTLTGRRELDKRLEKEWSREWSTDPLDEVVIGSGPHALIYAAVRAQKGVKVVLLEQSDRAGGSFACSKGPAFWLNSRNRPGVLGLPGEGMGLNVFPGSLLQPSMIGGGEYQSNDQLAWVIRANLMLLGIEVHTGVKVTNIEPVEDSGRYVLSVEDEEGGFSLTAGRVVIATGLGRPRQFNAVGDKPDRLLTFAEFMAQMDMPFPLRRMKRVAVIGAGDSGKTVVEALLGQGPTTGMSVSALDFVERIDWYGAPWRNQAEFCNDNRGRYGRIGKAIETRVFKQGRPSYYPTSGYESVMIGPKSYDWVINCTGYDGASLLSGFERNKYLVGIEVAKRVSVRNARDEVYLIGPAAEIALPEKYAVMAPGLQGVPENSTSIFRYAPLTAAFANSLPPVAA